MRQEIYNFRLSDEGVKDLLRNGCYAEHNSQRSRSGGCNMLNISFNQTARQCCITLSGYLNAATMEQFKSVVERVLQLKSKKVCIDCRELVSVSSAGLSLLAHMAQHLNMPVVLLNVRHSIHALMDISGLNRILTVKSDP